MRASDLVARLGGDEFVALFDLPPGCPDRPAGNRDGLTETAGRITEVLSAQVPVTGGWNVAVRASIGVVVAAPGSDLDEVLDRADAAMYRAKAAAWHRAGTSRPTPADGSPPTGSAARSARWRATPSPGPPADPHPGPHRPGAHRLGLHRPGPHRLGLPRSDRRGQPSSESATGAA